MQRTIGIITSLMILAGLSPGSSALAQGSSELAGGWIVTGWTFPNGETNSSPQRGLFTFTESGHYSMMYVTGENERAEFAGEEGPTDAEKIAAYDSFVANSGRYRVSGSTVTTEAFMAKSPNYMAAFGRDGGNEVSIEYAIADGTLTLTWASGFSATLRRPRMSN